MAKKTAKTQARKPAKPPVQAPAARARKTITLNMQRAMAEEIEARAASMHLTTSMYVKTILKNWMVAGRKLNLEEK